MTRLVFRLVTAVALLVALGAVIPAMAGARPAPRMATITAVAGPMSSPSPSPSASQSPPPCHTCVSPGDAICWEFAPYHCPVPVTLGAAAPVPVKVSFHTVPITAQPGVDYVDSQGTLTIPVGQLTGQIQIQLVPNPGLATPKTFAVQFFGLNYGQLTRSQAIVTIMPAGS